MNHVYLSTILAILFVDGILFLCYYFSVGRKKKEQKKRMGFEMGKGCVDAVEDKMNLKSAYPVIIYDVHYSFMDKEGNRGKGVLTVKKKGILNVGDEIRVYYHPGKLEEHITDYHMEATGNLGKFLITMMVVLPFLILLFTVIPKFL